MAFSNEDKMFMSNYTDSNRTRQFLQASVHNEKVVENKKGYVPNISTTILQRTKAGI